METQNENQTKMTTEQAQSLIDSEAKQAEQDRQLNSRFVKLNDGEHRELILSGVELFEAKVFDVAQGEKKLIAFELAETTGSGLHKQFTCSAKTQVARDLHKAIMEKKLRVNLKRQGLGRKTTYFVVATTV